MDYINVRPKLTSSQLSLPHGTKQKTQKKRSGREVRGVSPEAERTLHAYAGRSALPRSTLNVGLPKLLPVDWSNHILDATSIAVTFAALTVWHLSILQLQQIVKYMGK